MYRAHFLLSMLYTYKSSNNFWSLFHYKNNEIHKITYYGLNYLYSLLSHTHIYIYVYDGL